MARCVISWIDENGWSTADTNEAICMAVSEITWSNDEVSKRAFSCCAEHARTLDALIARGLMVAKDGERVLYRSRWTREALP